MEAKNDSIVNFGLPKECFKNFKIISEPPSPGVCTECGKAEWKKRYLTNDRGRRAEFWLCGNCNHSLTADN